MAAAATLPAHPASPASPALPPCRSLPGTVVVLHAHPDDEAIFTGATLRALADRGTRVVLVTATSGEEGVPRTRLAGGESLAQRRVAELERACELLGVARLALLGYADSGAHAAHGPRTRSAPPRPPRSPPASPRSSSRNRPAATIWTPGSGPRPST
jgi:GlcNAc-PI de-N-acetylase